MGRREELRCRCVLALVSWSQAHYSAIAAYARRRLDAHDADDLVAETFLVAWRRLDEIAEDELPWLIGVARNVRLNAHRAARRQTAVSARLAGAVSPAWEAEFVESEAVREAALSVEKRALHLINR